jgi:hypothetical protein
MKIPPQTAEERQHRHDMAELLQDQTLAQLRASSSQYADDEDRDAASHAQVILEMGRRGEWWQPGYETEVRFAKEYAEWRQGQLVDLAARWEQYEEGVRYAAAVHAARAELALREIEFAASPATAALYS